MSTSAISSHIGGHLRPLAAILCVDIEDYDGLLANDQQATEERVDNHRRESILPAIAQHDGRLIQPIGKATCAVFDNSLAAVRCAVAIRQDLVHRNALFPRQPGMQCRIGVGLVRLLGDRDATAGNGVNAVARLQSLSEPGTIYIAAGVYQRIKDKLGYECRSLGAEKLDDMSAPAPIYSVLFKPADIPRPSRTAWTAYAMAICVGLAVGGAAGWYRLDAGSATQAEKSPPVMVTLQQPSERTDGLANAAPDAPELPERAAPTALTIPSPAWPAPSPPPQLGEPPAAAVVPPESPVEPAAKGPGEVSVAAAVAPVPLRAARPYEPFRECAKCPEMIDLPGGTFVMGSNDDPTEQPAVRVSVPAFALGRLPVTVGEWRHCVAAKACSYQPEGDDDMPVHNVSWNDAQQYVTWLSSITRSKYRLPTEAEWEYAARGGTGTKYWWGSQPVAGKADCKGCSDASDLRRPMKAGSFAANPFGLHDMAGGVTQWVADCWHKNYRGAPTDGSAWDAANCRERVLRGGSWKQDVGYSRASIRDRYDAGVRYPTHGLRVARSPGE